MASFHGSVSASTKGGRKRATVAAPDPGVTGRTCSSVNGVYNTNLVFLAYLPNKNQVFISIQTASGWLHGRLPETGARWQSLPC